MSLVPSITETLLAWGVTPLAVTRFCEAPGVPTVGGTKNPDVAAIVACAPDVVVMDKEENRAVDAEALEADGVVVHVTHVRTVDDVAPTLARLAARRGVRRPSPAAAEASPRRRRRPRRRPPAAGRHRHRPRLGTDLAAAMDDDQRRNLRLVDPGRGRDRQRLRRTPRIPTRQSLSKRRRPCGQTSSWRHRSPTPSPSAIDASSRRWRRWSSSTARTSSGGVAGRRPPWPGSGSWRRPWPAGKRRRRRRPTQRTSRT